MQKLTIELFFWHFPNQDSSYSFVGLNFIYWNKAPLHHHFPRRLLKNQSMPTAMPLRRQSLRGCWTLPSSQPMLVSSSIFYKLERSMSSINWWWHSSQHPLFYRYAYLYIELARLFIDPSRREEHGCSVEGRYNLFSRLI